MFGNYFYGNEISEYGRKHGRVDYRAFSKAFDAVLNKVVIFDNDEQKQNYKTTYGF